MSLNHQESIGGYHMKNSHERRGLVWSSSEIVPAGVATQLDKGPRRTLPNTDLQPPKYSRCGNEDPEDNSPHWKR